MNVNLAQTLTLTNPDPDPNPISRLLVMVPPIEYGLRYRSQNKVHW